MTDCAGCQEPIEGPSYDPGCSYGCEIGAPCDHVFCNYTCYFNAAERADQNAQAAFHGG